MNFMHEILCRHIWNCNIQWPKMKCVGRRNKILHFSAQFKGPASSTGITRGKQKLKYIIFQPNDNRFALELPIHAKTSALGCVDGGHHFYSASNNALLLQVMQGSRL